MKKMIEKAEFAARQVLEEKFSGRIQEGWGIWHRALNEEVLKAVFSKREDADAYAHQSAADGVRGELRRMWLIVNESSNEVYALRDSGMRPVQAVDLDFKYRTKYSQLRDELMGRLSEEELIALGLRH